MLSSKLQLILLCWGFYFSIDQLYKTLYFKGTQYTLQVGLFVVTSLQCLVFG